MRGPHLEITHTRRPNRGTSRAARQLHISQPALHVKVNKLAESLGRPLYRSDGRRLALTPAGERVARFANELDDTLASFLAEMHGIAPTRPLVLAAGDGAYLYLLGDVIHDALTRRPAAAAGQLRPRPHARRDQVRRADLGWPCSTCCPTT